MGQSRPSTGRALIFGKPCELPESRRGLGYVPENPYLYDFLSPLEILRMGLDLHKVKIDAPDAHCQRWLERLDLAAVANSPLRSFSKGMMQRTAIAHALCIKPRLLVLDEPLSGLDPVGRHEVVELLAEYKAGGGTLFFTSHVLHDVERLADRFGLIHEGQLRSVRSPRELVAEEEILLVRSAGAAVVEGLRRDSGDCWSIEVPRSALWPTLERIHAAGHVVLEVRSRLTLETAFMHAIGRG
jgi:ABC-2 type transport system ATP-binding protein